MGEGFSSGLGRLTTGPAKILLDLADRATSRLLGHDVEIEYGAARAQLRPRSLHLSPTAAGIFASRIDTVDLVADDVSWHQGRIDQLRIRARGVHLTPGFSPAIVAGPIDIEATLHQESLDDWLAGLATPWRLTLDGEGRVAARHTDRERWGHVVVNARARDRTLTLTPEEAVVRGRTVRKTVQRFAKPIELQLPRLPADARVLRVSPHPDTVDVLAMVDEIREPISLGQLQQMQTALARATTGPLVLPRVR